MGDTVDEKGRPMVLISGTNGTQTPLAESVITGGELGGLLAVRRDGIEPAQQEQPVNAVYCVRPGGEPVLVASDFNRPNGLAFAPDESVLYVGDSRAFRVQVYDVAADGTLHNSRLFADVAHPEPGSPDGMKVDVEGNLYVTNALGIWTFAPDATFRGLIPLPETPANCAWGDDGRSLYITARTSVYRIRTRVAGRPPEIER